MPRTGRAQLNAPCRPRWVEVDARRVGLSAIRRPGRRSEPRVLLNVARPRNARRAPAHVGAGILADCESGSTEPGDEPRLLLWTMTGSASRAETPITSFATTPLKGVSRRESSMPVQQPRAGVGWMP